MNEKNASIKESLNDPQCASSEFRFASPQQWSRLRESNGLMTQRQHFDMQILRYTLRQRDKNKDIEIDSDADDSIR